MNQTSEPIRRNRIADAAQFAASFYVPVRIHRRQASAFPASLFIYETIDRRCLCFFPAIAVCLAATWKPASPMSSLSLILIFCPPRLRNDKRNHRDTASSPLEFTESACARTQCLGPKFVQVFGRPFDEASVMQCGNAREAGRTPPPPPRSWLGSQINGRGRTTVFVWTRGGENRRPIRILTRINATAIGGGKANGRGS